MDYSSKSRTELIALCKEAGIKGYSTKKKDELVALLSASTVPRNEVIDVAPAEHNIHLLKYALDAVV